MVKKLGKQAAGSVIAAIKAVGGLPGLNGNSDFGKCRRTVVVDSKMTILTKPTVAALFVGLLFQFEIRVCIGDMRTIVLLR